MPSDYDEFLAVLNEEQWFTQFREQELLTGIPDIPAYAVNEDGTDNTAEWKSRSMMAEGYKLCLSKLGIHVDD